MESENPDGRAPPQALQPLLAIAVKAVLDDLVDLLVGGVRRRDKVPVLQLLQEQNPVDHDFQMRFPKLHDGIDQGLTLERLAQRLVFSFRLIQQLRDANHLAVDGRGSKVFQPNFPCDGADRYQNEQQNKRRVFHELHDIENPRVRKSKPTSYVRRFLAETTR
ncbi:hypothetical protein CfE428DRAFT_0742 [Chthoniobacter flavus Ellin428]|uniref:Uncharacterized protein n=1 Tax=Chthoniobacter flavus Ellin428 TaxID=497964 RepID=B4CVQ5_9BACT|nr:hypothetical protein [Chthoniobacter flavus]EDY21497.1 hypothetical protein CfE428DRAFT_0742 [Chthoniobacter flavus Ellin428]